MSTPVGGPGRSQRSGTEGANAAPSKTVKAEPEVNPEGATEGVRRRTQRFRAASQGTSGNHGRRGPSGLVTAMASRRGAPSATEKLQEILDRHDIRTGYPPKVMEEVDAILESPGIDDPALKDLTHLPFLTIDNEDSRDLDQAMHIERKGDGGYRVYYALSDAAYYVKPGTALYEEAMKRGVTYYLPGMSVPMLPPALSEGVVSLNPNEDRRALTLVMDVGPDGQMQGTDFVRAKVRSRAKLSYEGVQAYHDGENDALAGRDITETLDLLKEVGERRIAEAEARDVVQIHRVETRPGISDEDPTKFVMRGRDRNDVERYNEQISLMCNTEGAKLLEAAGDAPHITPIYRVHPEPVEKRVRDFEDQLKGIVEAHDLDPEVWLWHRDRGESLADYVARLDVDGAHGRIARAIHRQSVMINQRSRYAAEPGPHHGLQVEPYARFSSPMREMVGIFTHREAFEKLTGGTEEGAAHQAAREEIVDLANRTKDLQRTIEKEADLLVLDQHLAEDLHRAPDQRKVRTGTLMGLTATKAYVAFDDPPFEVKLYLDDLAEHAGTTLDVDDVRAQAKSADPDVLPNLRVGDEITVRLRSWDEGAERYRFEVV